jgi:hypothetical protein
MDRSLGAFNEERQERSGIFLMDRLIAVGQSGVSVRALGGSRSGEMRVTRFLRNDDVTPGKMIETAAARTATRVGGCHVLVIQDTTTLRDDGKKCSRNLHPSIAVDADTGALLGLVHATFHTRVGGKKDLCGKRPFAEKESYRWLEATLEAAKLLVAGAIRVTVVADRECDIYDEFAHCPSGVDLLVRAHHDRMLADGVKLFRCVDDLAELGRETIQLPAGPGRPARQATLALKACPVRLKRPGRNTAAETAKLPPEVVLYFVEAREIDPPEGVPAAHWRLLSTHVVTTLAEARQVTAFYRERWTIEQLFRVMKTKGFDIEALRIADEKPFENLVTATLIAAIQVLQMVRERDGVARRPMEDVLETADTAALEAINATLEGKTERQKNPHAKGGLAYVTWVCARLGGWTGYYGKPGPVVIHKGFQRLKNMLDGWWVRGDV